MKVKCINNIQKTWILPFVVSKVYEVFIDRDFDKVVELYVLDDNGDEMTIASLELGDWVCEDNSCWYKDKWFKDHFKIVG